MCGRFTITHPNDALAHLFEAVPGNDLPAPPRFNVCPTQDICVVTAEGGAAGEGAAAAASEAEAMGAASDRTAPAEAAAGRAAGRTEAEGATIAGRRLRAMRWGFIPHWYESPTAGPLLINARSETVASKPAFRAAAKSRRCIVPASGFYEWSPGEDGARLPWYITRTDGAPMAFAAIWRRWERGGEGMDTCAIVTGGPGPILDPIHNREPVILAPADWALWLGEAGHGAAALMRPTGDGVLQAWRVDPAVNSNRAQGEGLVEPIAA